MTISSGGAKVRSAIVMLAVALVAVGAETVVARTTTTAAARPPPRSVSRTTAPTAR